MSQPDRQWSQMSSPAHPQPLHGADDETSMSNSPYNAANDSTVADESNEDVTPTDAKAAARAEHAYRLQNPPPSVRVRSLEGLRYVLEPIQQPLRARMCGYGDKDRRPISSPPIFKLSIFDAARNVEVDYRSARIAKCQFAAVVRLHRPQGTEDASLVRSPSSNVAVSQTQVVPFIPPPIPPSHQHSGQMSGRMMPPGGQRNGGAMSSTDTFSLPGASSEGRSIPNGGLSPYTLPPHYAPQVSPYTQIPRSPPGLGSVERSSNYLTRTSHPQPPLTPPADSNGYVYTRNLIGCTATSGLRLLDTEGKPGIFFIFSDISVRTDGWFRLKCEVFNVGGDTYSTLEVKQYAELNRIPLDQAKRDLLGPKQGSLNPLEYDETKLRDIFPCLAETFTNCFRVYSAKKFPGVTDSTDISKCFAKQGVKISIRKDTNGDRKGKAGPKRKRGEDDSEAAASDSE